MENIIISKYSKKNSKISTKIKLVDELEYFKNGRYKILVERCRYVLLHEGKEGYDRLKAELPGVTFCGIFEKARQAKEISFYNKLLLIDIDNIIAINLLELKKMIENDKFTYSVFLSPSAKGLKALIKVETEVTFHKNAFKAIQNYYSEQFHTIIDSSGSDCSRLCYVSYDPNLYINPNSEIFKFQLDEKGPLVSMDYKKNNLKKGLLEKGSKAALTTSFGLNKEYDKQLMKNIITYLRKHNKSITSTHEYWYQCAFAIANTFSYSRGIKFYLELCKMDGIKYDEIASIEKLQYCYLNKREINGVNFPTILRFAKEQGFINFKEKYSTR